MALASRLELRRLPADLANAPALPRFRRICTLGRPGGNPRPYEGLAPDDTPRTVLLQSSKTAS
jgi:hypothetical protein